MTTRTFTMTLGIILLLVGVLGFVLAPGGGLLLGIFAIDATHNLIHIASGIAGIAMAYAGASRLFCQIFGVVYLLVAILGFVATPTDGMLLGMMQVNMADHVLHLAIGAAAGYYGFVAQPAPATRT
ncbi:MAG: DUF4383 domain-containing protein [Acidobacteria bacterium]|nr:DUF4383 domain-containing protein [Acidobacteriota bacterium]